MEFEINLNILNENLKSGHTQKVVNKQNPSDVRYIFHTDNYGTLYYYLCRDINAQNRFNFCDRETPQQLLSKYRLPRINEGEGRRKSRRKSRRFRRKRSIKRI